MDDQGTLVIRGLAPEDAGNYSCQAANEVGTDEETVTLYYTGTPALGILGEGPPSLPVHKYARSICCVPASGHTRVVPAWWGGTEPIHQALLGGEGTEQGGVGVGDVPVEVRGRGFTRRTRPGPRDRQVWGGAAGRGAGRVPAQQLE